MSAAFIPLRLPIPKSTPIYNKLIEIHPTSAVVNAADIFTVEEFIDYWDNDEGIKFCRIQSSGGALVYVGLSEEELMNVVMQALHEHMNQQIQLQQQIQQKRKEQEAAEREAQRIADSISRSRFGQ